MSSLLYLEEVRIFIQIANNGKQLAKASLGFGRYKLRVSGFRVMKSNYQNSQGDYLWIVPPSFERKDGTRHTPIFFDKEAWKIIEKKICNAYKELESKSPENQQIEAIGDEEMERISKAIDS